MQPPLKFGSQLTGLAINARTIWRTNDRFGSLGTRDVSAIWRQNVPLDPVWQKAAAVVSSPYAHHERVVTGIL